MTSPFAIEQMKSRAYDQLAELAVKAKVKALRATEANDIRAILSQYFQESIMVMRRTGLAVNNVRPRDERDLRLVR